MIHATGCWIYIFDDAEDLIFSRGTKLVKFVHFLCMIYLYIVNLCILFRKKSANVFGRSVEIQWVALDFHPLILSMI